MNTTIVPGIRAIGLVAMILPGLALPATTYQDYAAAEKALQEQQERIYTLADRNGRYHESLVEPLQQLLLQQLEVNRYDEAAANAEYAIQVVRTSYGLKTPQQYDLQQIAVQIDLLRQDWEAINQRLDYYSTLILSNYWGTIPDRISRLLWLADMHVRGGIEDIEDKQAAHMREATWLNETAIGYAEKHGLGNTRLFAEMLYSLTQKYYLETRAISDGGATSYRLRQVHPTVHRVQDKFDALDRRHAAGLVALTELRELFRRVPGFGAEAIAMSELYIADWNALYNHSDDINADYQRAMTSMREAGITQVRIDRFFSSPVAIPSTRFDWRLADAMSIIDSGSGPVESMNAGDGTATIYRLSLLEPASHLAGFTQELALVDWRGGLLEDWSKITVSMTLNPDRQVTVLNNAFRTKSMVTGTGVELLDSEANRKTTRRAINRIKTLSFRPAFRNGEAVTSNLEVEYLVRDSAQPSVTPLIFEHWQAGFNEPNRNASLVVAAE